MKALRIDLESDIPVYRQIATGMRELIFRGDLTPGDTLPSVRDLGLRIGVNLNTVAKAYRLLADEGLVELRHGAAVRVAERPKAPAAQKDPEGQRLLREVLARWASRGLSRAQMEQRFHQAADQLFGPTASAGGDK